MTYQEKLVLFVLAKNQRLIEQGVPLDIYINDDDIVELANWSEEKSCIVWECIKNNKSSCYDLAYAMCPWCVLTSCQRRGWGIIDSHRRYFGSVHFIAASNTVDCECCGYGKRHDKCKELYRLLGYMSSPDKIVFKYFLPIVFYEKLIDTIENIEESS